MRNSEKLYRGEVHCTVCKQEGAKFRRESWNLVRNEDGTYSGYCHDHKPEDIYQSDNLCLVETCLHVPWRDVETITLHKTDQDACDRTGKVVTVTMRDSQNVRHMQRQGVEVLHGLQLMSDTRATIHGYGHPEEGNDCWTEVEWRFHHPVQAYIRDKYWGQERIDKFHRVCRLMAEIHEWEIVDETMPLLDRIAKAIDKKDA